MFGPEGDVWTGIKDFNLSAQSIPIIGLSPLFPAARCTANGEVCHLVVGEAEINAAISITSLILSSKFDLKQTYFLVAGIAGISPLKGTIGSVTFAKYAVQVALQYELDYRETPSNFSTGYIPQGAVAPGQYPTAIYGTEVFEVNAALRRKAVHLARKANLSDSSTAKAYRGNYAAHSAAVKPPSVIECDVATSDVYYSGHYLSEAFENTTKLFTNGSAVYCSTAQEDSAVLEALLRGALGELVDFSRIIIMRTASNFDRPYPGESPLYNLVYANSGGFQISLQNTYLAGIEVVKGILEGWSESFKSGIKAHNYIGDILGSLGGDPDFGPGKRYGGGSSTLRR
ncbi:MAG: hypothetical protein M1829_005826 [Trizodia sp. TS-e1964]|nr:MAG: hypothetical protein M1829_005826 [Trizodia sp. TS-e1964]